MQVCGLLLVFLHHRPLVFSRMWKKRIFISAGPLMLHLKARDSTFPSGTFTTIAFSIFSLVYLVSPPALYYWLWNLGIKKTLGVSNRLLEEIARRFKCGVCLKTLCWKLHTPKTLTYLSSIFSRFRCITCIKNAAFFFTRTRNCCGICEQQFATQQELARGE